MIEEHQELLGQIEEAERTASALYSKGEQIGDVARQLRSCGQVVQDRVQAYQRAATQARPLIEIVQPAAQGSKGPSGQKDSPIANSQ